MAAEEPSVTSASPFRILALAGSYRTGSFNQALIAAVRTVAPDYVEIDEFDLRTVPYYDGDLEAAGDPEPVQRLKAAVREADALLFVTPEYNSGIPGVLKNGIDWASRFYPEAPLSNKPAAVIGATPGRGGTRLAQEQLRKVLGRTGTIVIEDPELALARAGDVIEDGVVVSDEVLAVIGAVVDAVVERASLSDQTGSASTVP
jgi:chromate reductase